MIDLIGNIANIIYAVGSGARNLLWLRISLIFGALLEAVYQFYIAEKPLYTGIFWCGIIIILNTIYVVRILHEKYTLKLNDKEKILKETAFKSMPAPLFKKLLACGKWKKYYPETILAKESEPLAYMLILCEGLIEISLENKILAFLKQGNFVGEMTYITNEIPKATAKCKTVCEVFEWDITDLKQVTKKDDDMGNSLQLILSNDLIKKLLSQNASQ